MSGLITSLLNMPSGAQYLAASLDKQTERMLKHNIRQAGLELIKAVDETGHVPEEVRNRVMEKYQFGPESMKAVQQLVESSGAISPPMMTTPIEGTKVTRSEYPAFTSAEASAFSARKTATRAPKVIEYTKADGSPGVKVVPNTMPDLRVAYRIIEAEGGSLGKPPEPPEPGEALEKIYEFQEAIAKLDEQNVLVSVLAATMPGFQAGQELNAEEVREAKEKARQVIAYYQQFVDSQFGGTQGFKTRIYERGKGFRDY